MTKAVRPYRSGLGFAPVTTLHGRHSLPPAQRLSVVSSNGLSAGSAPPHFASSGVLQRNRWWDGLSILLLMAFSFAAFATVIYLSASAGSGLALDWLDLSALSGLWFCSICFLLNRFGTSRRMRLTHPRKTPRQELGPSGAVQHVTVLIPSYCEEPRVIRMTLLSAALATYSARNIVVLVDDPVRDTVSISKSLGAIQDVCNHLAEPVAKLRSEHRLWLQRRQAKIMDISSETARLADQFQWLASWLESNAQNMLGDVRPIFAHIDRFFFTAVIAPLAEHYRTQASRVVSITTVEEVDVAFAMLATALCSDISSFQRKQFENLPHTANKAMNLNAYIGLMGRSFRRRSRLKQEYLKPEKGPRPDLVVREPDYVLTLDADSLIRPNYIRDMIAILEGNPKLAVAQTPYLAFPGAPTTVERFAGATTDIQYLVHQGSTYFNASYWVGANALIRHSALRKLETIEQRDGKAVSIFIQDRTVIEDTGSTIDLLAKGYGVYNHNEPLAYSATPSDFGALCIQRKRWCNGGLIIVRDLLLVLFKAPKGSMTPISFILRVYYLLSPVIGNVSLFLLMVRSRSDLAVTLAMVAAIAPYFLLYSLDLRRMGYRCRDVFSVMSLNLLLLPVAFAGILESLVQLLTGRKTSFARTPKVEGRTGIPSVYMIFYVLLIGQMAFYITHGLLAGDYWVTITPLANGALVMYGLLRFIGARHAVRDSFVAIGISKQAPDRMIPSV